MNRFFTPLVAGIMLITLSSFFNNGITIRMEMPDVIEAGTEVKVNITINKGKLTGFARFQQELPYGFTASSISSANADFSFQDRKVRLIWLQLPDNEEITISYVMTANERLTGKMNLDGHFSYIENNERKTVDINPQTVAINPSPNIDRSLIVDVNDYAKTAVFDSPISVTSRVICLRQEPVWMQDENVFLVTLLVNKEAVKKFAKIEEAIPSGYTAVNVDSKGGIFTYKDNSAKFIWMDLPAEPYFTVTYKLIPDEGLAVNPSNMQIAGAFSYMIGDKTITSDVIERKETLAGLNQSQVNNLLKGIVPGRTAGKPVTVVASASTKPVSVRGTTSVAIGDGMLMPESGIYYRVQIAAGHKPLSPQRYFRRYKLDYSVMKEQHDGWFKYSVGSFAEYKDARDYRVHLSNTSPLKDAFIAAYNNGKRITVQDALMALNQKWYK